jgi:pSer/pThr/pTyr-binding forkhead associated (FHA) protein
MRARLIPLDGGPPVEIEKDLILVGRKESCDLRLDHKSVSKLHCVIVRTDGLLLLRDLGSTNGTRVNGIRVRRAALLPNDQLNIASVRYRVFLGPDEAAGNAYTQRLDTDDVARMKKAAGQDEDSDSDMELPDVPVQTNALPDLYPNDHHSPRD